MQDIKLHDALHHGFYRAVVEDNNDPLAAGRVRVRIWGLHSQSSVKAATDGIPTNELPWAEPMLPIAEGGHTKFGFFSVPIVNSHVLVVFENGNPLRPIYIGSLPSGLNDWETKGGTYPDNTVLQVHGGHYIELDSTSGNMRVKVYHKSGTNIEMKENGDAVYTTTNDETVTVSGDKTDTITGQQKENYDGGQDTNVTGPITIDSDTSVTVTAPAVTIASPVVIMSGGTVAMASQAAQKKLMNEDIITIYNSHTHDENDNAPTATEVPNQLISTGEATTNTTAS